MQQAATLAAAPTGAIASCLRSPRHVSRPAVRVRIQRCSAAYLEAPAPGASAAPAGATTTATASIKAPVIDARGFLAREAQGAPPPLEVAQEIREACTEIGCFQLVNHGVSLELIADMKATAGDFFALPLEQKLKVKRNPTNPNGFFNDEYTKQILDKKECFDFSNQEVSKQAAEHTPGCSLLVAPNQWPEGQERFRQVQEAYFHEMSRVSFRLLEAFSLGLGVPLDAMHPYFQGDHTSFMRLNFYPATPPTEQGLALNHHTDAGFLTILIQDQDVHGLQFHKHGLWHDVTPAPDALTINVGDQCQVLTNDLFKAPVHRVLSPHSGRARLSAPFFFNPRPEAVIAPLPQFVSEAQPAVYRPIPWAEFRNLRFLGDCKDVGQEVQIYHFKA